MATASGTGWPKNFYRLVESSGGRSRQRQRADRADGRPAGPARRPGPAALGPAADPPWPCRPGPGGAAWRHTRPLRRAGRDRRLPREGGVGQGHRLGAHRRAVRGPCPPDPVPGRRAEPRRRRWHGLRPSKGLEIADALTSEPALAGYVQLPAVRGDLLAKLGRPDEARAEFSRAAALTSNERERALFRARAAECR